jgi:hypothetical protein
MTFGLTYTTPELFGMKEFLTLTGGWIQPQKASTISKPCRKEERSISRTTAVLEVEYASNQQMGILSALLAIHHPAQRNGAIENAWFRVSKRHSVLICLRRSEKRRPVFPSRDLS